MKSAITAAVALICVGCTTSSGVHKLGPDTWLVSVRAHSEAGNTEKAALTEANAKCIAEGREIFVTNLTSRYRATDVTFRCLDADDPDLVRPVFTQAPDTVIEDRRN